jgi:riboflavin synthase alpha subunit
MNTNNKKEGKVAKTIENQTAKIPSDVYLWSSIASMGASLTLKIFQQNKLALFVGQWAAPFLAIGIYNKIVKTEGSD